MEKGPVVVTPVAEVQPAKTKRKHVFLTSWASVATALLLMVIIGGAFYTAELRSRECEDTPEGEANYKDYTYEITMDEETTKEDIHLEESSQSELLIKKNKDGAITLITVIDYTKKISASYIPAQDICYLLAGEDMDFADQWASAKNVTVSLAESDVKHAYHTIDTKNSVTDQSLIPLTLRPYCHGKATFWAHPTTEEDMATQKQKQKRGYCYYYYCYYYYWWGWWYYDCYWYWYWCYYY